MADKADLASGGVLNPIRRLVAFIQGVNSLSSRLWKLRVPMKQNLDVLAGNEGKCTTDA